MKSLIVVDIQPSTHRFHKNINEPILKYIKTNFKKYENIVWFYNNDIKVGVTDEEGEVLKYIKNYRVLGESEIADIYFIPKNYNFFRNWMDIGIEEEFIKKVVRYMIRNDIDSSLEIEDFVMEMLIETFYDIPDGVDIKEEYDYLWEDAINMPNFDWNSIRNLKEVDICGGGRNRCLAEMKLLLESSGVKVNVIEELTYMGDAGKEKI